MARAQKLAKLRPKTLLAVTCGACTVGVRSPALFANIFYLTRAECPGNLCLHCSLYFLDRWRLPNDRACFAVCGN